MREHKSTDCNHSAEGSLCLYFIGVHNLHSSTPYAKTFIKKHSWLYSSCQDVVIFDPSDVLYTCCTS